MNVIAGQRYKHYKGDTYQIVALARREEDRAILVIYQRVEPTGDPGPIWARPLSEWFSAVGGKCRYELVRE